jgi:hypothetical protein
MTSPELVGLAQENNFIRRLAEVERRLKLVEGQAIGADQIPDVTEHLMINGPIGLGNLTTEPPSPAPGDNTGEYSIGHIYQKDYLLKFRNGWGADMDLTGFANPGLTQAIAVTPFEINAHVPIGCGVLTETGTQLSANLLTSRERAITDTTAASAGSSAGFYTPFLGYTGKIKRIAGRIGLDNAASKLFYFGLFSKVPYATLTNMYALGLSNDDPTIGESSYIYLFARSGNLYKSVVLFTPSPDDTKSVSFEIYIDSVNRRVAAFAWPTRIFSGRSSTWQITTAVIDDVTLDFSKNARLRSEIYTTANAAKHYYFGGAYVEFANENTIDEDNVTLSWDTYIRADAATTNYKTSTSLYVGENNTGVGIIYRTLIKFAIDTFSYTDAPPRVGEAVLNLYLDADLCSNARRYSVYRLLKAATADATWNTYDGSNSWGAAGGFDATDCEQTDIGSIDLTATESEGWIQIPLDAAKIEEMTNGIFANNGFLIRCDTEANDAYRFASSEEGAHIPYLTVYEL